MMPKDNRIPSHRIPVVFRYGKRAIVSVYTFIFLPNHTIKSTAVVMVRKSGLKKATERNRIKRILRASIYSQIHSFHQPLDLIVLVQKKPRESSSREMTLLLQSIIPTINKKIEQSLQEKTA